MCVCVCVCVCVYACVCVSACVHDQYAVVGEQQWQSQHHHGVKDSVTIESTFSHQDVHVCH